MEKFDNVPISALNINKDGKFIYYNDAFRDEFLEEEQKDIDNINTLTKKIALDTKNQKVYIHNNLYNVYVTKTKDTYNIFFCKIDIEDKYTIIVGLIFVDNYDEVLEDLEEVKHPLIGAIIDGRIKKISRNIGGILQKFEKDKYLFIISKENLEALKKTKFDILDNIRDIDMGNKIPVTLSIGLGLGGHNLGDNMDFARASIDLALSRGGDQVVIKSRENYEFFGGHSKGVERNSRVRARVKAYALTELIENASNVIIMGHKNVDLDCIGAGIGVHSIVTSFGKRCNIVLNNITSSVKSLYDRVIKEDAYKDVFIHSDEALLLVHRKTLVIVVDVFKKYLCECPDIIDKAKKVVVFDHHRKGVDCIEEPVLIYHEPYASSTCELITEMIMYINRPLTINSIEADAMLAGIIVDTKNFAFKTGIKTFESAAYLKKKGADTVRVKKLFKDTLDMYKSKSNVVNNMQIYLDNLAISSLNEEVENPLLVIAKACDELLDIKDIQASFVLCKFDNKICISARSFGDINVQIIMEKLGGGGHQSISATQIEDINMDSAIKMLKQTLDEYFKEES